MLLRMAKQLSIAKSSVLTHLQFACILLSIAHRTGAVKSTQHTQGIIVRELLRFAVNLYLAEGDCAENMQLLQLSLQNLMLLIKPNDRDSACNAFSNRRSVWRLSHRRCLARRPRPSRCQRRRIIGSYYWNGAEKRFSPRSDLATHARTGRSRLCHCSPCSHIPIFR